MTDRELLALAAKAAGIAWNGRIDSWNPLTDDGDALRLAVKLRLDLHFEFNGLGGSTPIVEVFFDRDDLDMSRKCEMQDCTNDPYAATRRAIVRAAAAIGSAA